MRRLGRRAAPLAIAVAGCVLCVACTPVQNVAPWEKGYLAEPAMALERPPLESRAVEQMRFSKEAASGGQGAGGGGCGCN